MKVFTDKEKSELSAELIRAEEEYDSKITAIKKEIEDVRKDSMKFFHDLADTFNAARDYYYNNLEAPDRYRGDFPTMEIAARVNEDFQLVLVGVWGSIHARVSRKGDDSYEAVVGDDITYLNSEHAVQVFLMNELTKEHPRIRKKMFEIHKLTERLSEIRNKVGLTEST